MQYLALSAVFIKNSSVICYEAGLQHSVTTIRVHSLWSLLLFNVCLSAWATLPITSNKTSHSSLCVVSFYSIIHLKLSLSQKEFKAVKRASSGRLAQPSVYTNFVKRMTTVQVFAPLSDFEMFQTNSAGDW